MLTQIFKSVLLMSAAGGVLALFWLLAKPITQRLFSPKWQYRIWLTVLIVMVLPIRFNTVRMSGIPNVMPKYTQSVRVNSNVPVKSDNQNNAAAVLRKTEDAAVHKTNMPHDIFPYISLIWLIGAIFAFAVKAIRYNMFLRTIHKNAMPDAYVANIPKRLKVFRTDMLDAPLVVGVVKPTLFLPSAELSESDLNYILKHELTHYKRNDILYKWFAAAVQSVHWFNPIIYTVLRQIDSECEISCDYDVTVNMTNEEQKGYMKMILDLQTNSRNVSRPLTTQMSNGKRILKRRFTMIKSKKTTSKFMSAISAILAAVMLSATVFASGIAQNGFKPESIKYEVYNGENEIVLKNKPFIYESDYYLPLRETLNGFGITDIIYEDGEITIAFPKDMTNGETDKIMLKIGYANVHYGAAAPGGYGVVMRSGPVLYNDVTYVTVDYFEDIMRSVDIRGFRLNVVRPTEPENYYAIGEKVFIGTAEEQDAYSGEIVKRIIVDENGETIAVIPVESQTEENIERKLQNTQMAGVYEGFYQKFCESAQGFYDLKENLALSSELSIIDKDEKDIAYIGPADIIKMPKNEYNKDFRIIITNTYTPQTEVKEDTDEAMTPENTVSKFFDSFGRGDFEDMKKYCTQSCVDTYFQEDGVFGMKKASLTEMYVSPTELLKSSNGFNIFVTVNMIPSEISVFDPNSATTSFYVLLERQNDGIYRINGFATGL